MASSSGDSDVSAKQPLYIRLTTEESFRFLELLPGSGTDPLRGTLFQHATLSAKFTYSALSYRWTDPDPINPHTITLNTSHSLPIGPNLHAALLRLRNTSTSRYLWIDQICINQNDNDEKVPQIGIMGGIYAGSTGTIIWLGEGDAETDVAMQLFPIFVRMVQYEEERFRARSVAGDASNPSLEGEDSNVAAPQTSSTTTASTADFSEWSHGLGVHICKLFQRDWFGRLWTLQEAALSQDATVYCGRHSFLFHLIETFERGCNNDVSGNWNKALEAIGWRSRKVDAEIPERSMLAHAYTVASLKRSGLGGTGTSMSSVRVLESLRGLECSQHQDRIYSIFKFLDRELVGEVLRSAEMDPKKLYWVVAMKLLGDGDLDCLGAAGRSQQRATYRVGSGGDSDGSRPYLNLPSWVPDWTFTSKRSTYWVLNRDHVSQRGIPLFSAGGQKANPDYQVQFASHPGHIRLPVVHLGTITACTPPFCRPSLPAADTLDDQSASITYMTSAITHYANFIALATDLAATCTSQYPTSSLARSACHSTLTANLTSPVKRTSQNATLVPANREQIDEQFATFNKQVHIADEQSWAFARMTTMATNPLTMDEMMRIQNLTLAAQSSTVETSIHRSLMTALTEVCSGRVFFTTEDHRMGMAPDIAQVGDLIVVVIGACTPFVIRQSGDIFEAVGECFVHGVMDGEFLERAGWAEMVEYLDVA